MYRRYSHSSANADSVTACGYLRRPAQRPHQVEHAFTFFDPAEFMSGCADYLKNQPDPTFIGRPVAEGEGKALPFFIDAKYDELPGRCPACYLRCFQVHGVNRFGDVLPL